MTLLPKLYTIDQLHKEVGHENLSRRTLEDIIRELGYRKGRGKQWLFNKSQAVAIQGELICQLSINQEQEKNRAMGTKMVILSEAMSTDNNLKSLRARRTRETLKALGINSNNQLSHKVQKLHPE